MSLGLLKISDHISLENKPPKFAVNPAPVSSNLPLKFIIYGWFYFTIFEDIRL